MPSYILNPFTGQPDATGAGSGLAVGATIAGANPDSVLVTDGSSTLQDVGSLTDGQLVIGSTGNTPVAASLTGTTDQLTVTPGAGTITLSLPQDIGTTSSPTFSTVISNIDKAGTLNIGTTNATTVNVGSAGSAINVLNTLNVNTHKITNVVDPTLAQDAATKNYTDITFVPLTQKGAANGVATLDAGGKIPVAQLPNTVMELQGFWNASTNTPTLTDGTGNPGDVYEVDVAGTTNFGNGPISFAVGDWAVYAADGKYHKSLNSNAVTSVNGQVGTVVLDTDDISEGVTNLYFSDVRAQAAITGGASSIVTSDLLTNRALISDASGKVDVSSVTDVELGYVSGVSSSIQSQLGNKAATNLSNLVATSINQALLPSGTNTYNIGATGNIWASGFFNLLKDTTGGTVLNSGTRRLVNSSAVSVLDFSGTDLDVLTRKIVNVTNPTSNQDAATKLYVDNQISSISSIGDIPLTVFAASNNQLAPVDVTGFVFSNAVVRSFRAQVSVVVNATTSYYETFDLMAIQNATGWEMTQSTTGDDSSIVFTITSSGQIQYTSLNYPGFVSAAIKFRALIT